MNVWVGPAAALAFSIGANLAAGTEAVAASVPEAFVEIAQVCAPNVHPVTLGAIIRQESGGNPYAIGVNRGTARLKRQPTSASEAIATATWLKEQGHDFDGGLAQINVRNLQWLGLSVADLFDPCKNLRAAEAVLTDCYSRAAKGRTGGQAALQAALSCYNTGSFTRGVANGYVAKVASKAGLGPPSVALGQQAQAPSSSLEAISRHEDAVSAGGDAFGRGRRDAFSATAETEAETERERPQVMLREVVTRGPAAASE